MNRLYFLSCNCRCKQKQLCIIYFVGYRICKVSNFLIGRKNLICINSFQRWGWVEWSPDIIVIFSRYEKKPFSIFTVKKLSTILKNPWNKIQIHNSRWTSKKKWGKRCLGGVSIPCRPVAPVMCWLSRSLKTGETESIRCIKKLYNKYEKRQSAWS